MRSISYETSLKLSSYCDVINLNEDKKILYHKLSGQVILIPSQIEETLTLYKEGKELSLFLNNHSQEDKLLNSLIVNEFLIEDSSIEDVSNFIKNEESILKNSIYNLTIDLFDFDNLNEIKSYVAEYARTLKKINATNVQVVFKESIDEVLIINSIDTVKKEFREQNLYSKMFFKTGKKITENLALELKKRNVGIGLYWNNIVDHNIETIKKYRNKYLIICTKEVFFNEDIMDYCRTKQINILVTGELENQLITDDIDIDKLFEFSKANTDYITSFWDIPVNNYRNLLHLKKKFSPIAYLYTTIGKGGIFSLENKEGILSTEINRSNVLKRISTCDKCLLQGCCNGWLQKNQFNSEVCNIAKKYFEKWMKSFTQEILSR